MDMDIKIFDRVEKKYLITAEQRDSIISALKKYMQEDKYHTSTVFNVYFDTDNFDFIIKSIEKPEFKEKLRARSYGGYDKVFFEIKTKLKGKDMNYGYKRRVLVTHKDYDKFILHKNTMEELAAKKIEQPSDLQIAKEVDYLVSQFDLKPKIIVYYDRTSFITKENLRVTFDENLSYRDRNLKFFRKSNDKHYFNDEKNIIMEIKANGVMPLWLVKILSANKAYPRSFSKIGSVYVSLRKEKNV